MGWREVDSPAGSWNTASYPSQRDECQRKKGHEVEVVQVSLLHLSSEEDKLGICLLRIPGLRYPSAGVAYPP